MRTLDATFLNSVANMAGVREWLGGEGDIDLTKTLLDTNNYAFVNEYGGFVGHRSFGGRYECHTMFSPNRHGVRDIMALMRYAQQFMFVNTDCDEIVTRVNLKHKGQIWLAKQSGLQEQFVKEGVSYQSLPLDRWAAMCSTTREEGGRFHGLLEAAKKANGSSLAAHPDDPQHDSMVGAALLMAKAGNGAKAANVYNRWATFASYAPVILLSEQPPIVDFHDAVAGLNSQNEVEILLCR